MQSFRDWINTIESSPATRALDAPWAYPALYVGGNPFSNGYSPKRINNYKSMVKRDSQKKKKKTKKPNNTIDAFVREMELLKQDLAHLSEKKRKDQEKQAHQDQKPKSSKPVKVEIDDDLKRVAKIVVSNLKQVPDYYTRLSKIDQLVGIDKNKNPLMKKVKRVDIKQIARDLGLDFDKVKFTPETFRRGVETELQRDTEKVSNDKSHKDQKDPSVQKSQQTTGKEGLD